MGIGSIYLTFMVATALFHIIQLLSKENCKIAMKGRRFQIVVAIVISSFILSLIWPILLFAIFKTRGEYFNDMARELRDMYRKDVD